MVSAMYTPATRGSRKLKGFKAGYLDLQHFPNLFLLRALPKKFRADKSDSENVLYDIGAETRMIDDLTFQGNTLPPHEHSDWLPAGIDVTEHKCLQNTGFRERKKKTRNSLSHDLPVQDLRRKFPIPPGNLFSIGLNYEFFFSANFQRRFIQWEKIYGADSPVPSSPARNCPVCESPSGSGEDISSSWSEKPAAGKQSRRRVIELNSEWHRNEGRSPRRTRRPTASFGTIPTYENPKTEAAVLQWLDFSLPSYTNRVQFPARSLRDFRMWESCRDDATGRRVFSGISRFLRHLIPALTHTQLASLPSALNTSGQQWRSGRALSSHHGDSGSVGSHPDFRMWESCWMMPLAGGFFPAYSRFDRPCIPSPLHPRVLRVPAVKPGPHRRQREREREERAREREGERKRKVLQVVKVVEKLETREQKGKTRTKDVKRDAKERQSRIVIDGLSERLGGSKRMNSSARLIISSNKREGKGCCQEGKQLARRLGALSASSAAQSPIYRDNRHSSTHYALAASDR
ncbi:hypothetical protein PR048_023064 [Dryococelus australis]|uniref:Uncharacterized protein n=1 Tax=Dryococelus australis TaxID=614101 RepID=A0ABQ9GT46_9NEOP|nr:hypothetical protein PR048_023064 [Dryococelus australis]